jgi:hypothetical protein
MDVDWENILAVIKTMCLNHHQVLVIPIIVGTIPRNDIPDIPGCNNIFLHLPPLEPEHARNVLASDNLIQDPKLVNFWNQMGIVPRNLENAIYFANGTYTWYKTDFVTATKREVFSLYRFKDKYHNYTNYDKKLLSLVFSGTKIPIYDHEWSIMRLGYVFCAREGQVYIPYFIFEYESFYVSMRQLFPGVTGHKYTFSVIL